MPRMNVKPFVKRPQSQAPIARYEVRFVNGNWTIFDLWNYDHGPAVGTYKEAQRILEKLEAGELRWAA